MTNKFKTIDMVYIAVFAVLIAICSWISIPTTVPFTLQTFAVFLAVGVLGGKRGSLSVLIYILLGAVGIPVFAGFSGGFGNLLGWGLVLHRAGIMKPVGNLDEDDTDVLTHGQKHFAQILHLLLFQRAVLDPGQLCDALD